MALPSRFRLAVLATSLLLAAIQLAVPAVAAADPGSPSITGALAQNDTALFGVTAAATGIPRQALEEQEIITIFRFEGPGTDYPGARPIVASPRSIELTTNLPTLVILAAVAAAVLACVMLRRRGVTADGGEQVE